MYRSGPEQLAHQAPRGPFQSSAHKLRACTQKRRSRQNLRLNWMESKRGGRLAWLLCARKRVRYIRGLVAVALLPNGLFPVYGGRAEPAAWQSHRPDRGEGHRLKTASAAISAECVDPPSPSCFPTSMSSEPPSQQPQQPTPPNAKRGRKRNDNLPPNRARDVQRAFRARRAAHLEVHIT